MGLWRLLLVSIKPETLFDLFLQIERAFLEQKKADEKILRLAEAQQVFSLLLFPFMFTD